MSISVGPPRPAPPEGESSAHRVLPGAGVSGGARDHGEVIAAALVRVASHASPGTPARGGAPGARLGVVLQTVSAVSWLSAGRASGTA